MMAVLSGFLCKSLFKYRGFRILESMYEIDARCCILYVYGGELCATAMYIKSE